MFARSLLTIAAAIAATTAMATPGFFVSREQVDPAAELAVGKAGFSCGLLLSYNLAGPGLQLTHVGGACDATEETAITAASFLAASQAAAAGPFPPTGKEAAIPPVYQCSTNVLWDSSAPSSVSLSTTGASCESSRSSVLHRAVQAVACMHHNVPCVR